MDSVAGVDDSVRAVREEQRTLRNEQEAFTLACIAIHDHCIASGAEVPNFELVRYEAQQTSDDRWVFMVRDAGGRRFLTRLPSPSITGATVTVAMYVTSPSRAA
ncbi:hypothetical protein K7640_18045 [Micromonospora sp. PLK6-60]|uniref:hypothetical protein n=1 Tax=Micromonospora sp. PLK6-60 TaxID=2873383 RepID=UPI001CA61498|nr:hypothetical protein [Micromonospora sp. PLK6-60]MBY8873735.1 hypothetical protein [Micromonospora sp. PLK6-60]